MSASRPLTILCEVGTRWSAAWRRCETTTSRWVAVKSMMEVRKLLDEAPASAVIVEFPAVPLAALLEWLSERAFGHCESAVILVGDAGIEPLRWRLMELGAMLVITSERQLPEAAHAARRHLQQWKSPVLGVRERIWESLPWSDASPMI